MSNENEQIIKILKEYIPRKKSIPVNETHAIRNSYICANPAGPVLNDGCPEDDPLCNCPAKELMPREEYIASLYELLLISDQDFINQIKEELRDNEYAIVKNIDDTPVPEIIGFYENYNSALEFLRGITPEYNEPTNEELDKLLRDSKECDKIEEVLGEEWLGCMWEDPNSPLSCNCPEVGRNFQKYLAYNRTLATFWSTPDYVPLYSIAQRSLLGAQTIMVSVYGDLTIRPGDIIFLDIESNNIEDIDIKRDIQYFGENANSKYSGRWMVFGINHKISGVKNHKMELVLVRDSLPVSGGSKEEGSIDDIL